MLNFRDLVRLISPSWFRKGIAEKLLYVFGLHFDTLIEFVTAAVKLRFPGAYNMTSLPDLSRERRIRQGIGESDVDFAVRLTKHLAAHFDAGGPYQLLEQVWHHYKNQPGGSVRAHLIYMSGARFVLETDGSIVRDAASFTTGLGAANWGHWWLVYEWPTEIGGPGLWDDPGLWDNGGVWDSELTLAEVTDLRLIPTEWNNAHCLGHLIVLGPDGALWDVPDEPWDNGGLWDAGTDEPIISVEIQ